MRLRTTFARAGSVAACAALLLVGGTTAANAAVGVIEDDSLAACINTKLGRAATVEITNTDLVALDNDLWCQGQGIASLEGLQGATNLKWINFGSNSIVDATPLSGLTQLWKLELNNNQLTTLEALRPLTNLQQLRVDYNSEELSSLEPLAGLTQLTNLDVNVSSVSDLSPLSGLTNLTDLSVNNSAVVDVRPLAGLAQLSYLALSGNDIVDVAPLAQLPQLTSLLVASNNVSDLSAFPATLGWVNFTNQDPVLSADVRYVPVGAAEYTTVLDWAPKGWGGSPVNLGTEMATDTGERFAGVQRTYGPFGNSLRVPFVDPAGGHNFSGRVEVKIIPAEFTSAQPADAEAEEAYEFQFAVTDGFPTASWATSGSVPTGLSLSQAGLLSGTPTTAGSFEFRATATDTWGNVIETPVSVVVADAAVTQDEEPTVSAPASQSVRVGSPAKFTVHATGAPAPTIAWERSTDQGKTWVPVSSGIATTEGTSTLTITPVNVSQNGDLFRAAASNTAGEVRSAPAKLGVTEAPGVNPEAGKKPEPGSGKPTSQVQVRLVETGGSSGSVLVPLGAGALLLGAAAITANTLARRRSRA